VNVTSQQSFGLSHRKFLIIRAVVAGYTEEEIARRLFLSVQDVERDLQDIFVKVGVSNKLGLVLFAVRYGLSETDRGREPAAALGPVGQRTGADESAGLGAAPFEASRGKGSEAVRLNDQGLEPGTIAAMAAAGTRARLRKIPSPRAW